MADARKHDLKSSEDPASRASAADKEQHDVRLDELDRLYRALSDVTLENHPRTARLLASGTRKAAQKVIEEAGEVALEAVRHRTGGIVRESADLLYHLVVLWRRVGLDPGDVWTEMRSRADTLGIAEKPLKRVSKKISGRSQPLRIDDRRHVSATETPQVRTGLE